MPHELHRTVTIPASRLRPWLDGFRRRHGETETLLDGDTVRLTATDGAEALIAIPFPPLVPDGPLQDALLRHVALDRRLGALLIRKGGYAVGVFSGSRLLASKVGSGYVQGRTKAGGWSQQRYARRRDNQSRKAYEQAAEEAARLLLPRREELQGLVTGGDRPAIEAVLADPRLAVLRPLVLPHALAVPDPRLRVLQALPDQFLTVSIHLNDLA